MANQSEAMQTELLAGNDKNNELLASGESLLSEEQHYRSGAYGVLAALLGKTPDRAMLDRIAGFSSIDQSGGEMALSMSMLGLAATTCQPESIDDEFHDLFIGLGRGELVPYGSWYLTGFLMERPLGRLRDDLASMGFQRDADCHVPEDHVAALCEVMQMLIIDSQSHEQQADFFNTHMSGWVKRFATDLSEAKSAVFYRAVGRFAIAFFELETRYLAMQV